MHCRTNSPHPLSLHRTAVPEAYTVDIRDPHKSPLLHGKSLDMMYTLSIRNCHPLHNNLLQYYLQYRYLALHIQLDLKSHFDITANPENSHNHSNVHC